MKIKRIKWVNVVELIIYMIAVIDLIYSFIKMQSASLTSFGLLINGFEIIYLYFIEVNGFYQTKKNI